MKTTLMPPEPPPNDEVHVGCTAEDGKVHLVGVGLRHAWRRSFDPGQAVKLWRCLMGECETATADDEHGDAMKLWNHVDPKLGDLWELVDASGERLLCLDADQAMALAWAIEKCCGIALYTSTPGAKRPCDWGPSHAWEVSYDTSPSHVWVLSSKVMLKGDRAENGAEQLGGEERVFATKDAAFDALREFLRPLVNEADDDDARNNVDRTVDDILDDILDDHCTDDTPHGDHWSYDGRNQSFEVTLSEVKVEQGEGL